MKSIRIHTNDKLAKDEDGNFFYTDTYGETIELNEQTIWSWMANEGIEITPEIEAFIEGGND